MQTTSQAYKDIFYGLHSVECRLDVFDENGDGLVHTFYKNEILRMNTLSALFGNSTPSIGGTVSGEIDAELLLQSDVEIPRMAMLRPYIRLTNGTSTSEWLPKGVYWLDTRETDYITHVIHIHGYDAMLKAEQVFFTINLIPIDFQMFDFRVLDGYTIFGKQTYGVLSIMGVELEDETREMIVANGEKFTIPIPSDIQIDSDGQWSIVKGTCWDCRELLSQIATCYRGNFCFDENGRLKLVKFPHFGSDADYLVDDNDDPITFGGEEILLSVGELAYLNQSVGEFDLTPAFEPFSSVTVYTGDGDDHYTWPLIPPQTGRNLRVDTKVRTGTLINRIGSVILEAIRGYVYKPFSATNAILDPAAQLGDYVSIDGEEYVINTMDTTFDALCTANISSPQDKEIDHEYPFATTSQKKSMRDYISLDNRINKIETLLNPIKKILEGLIKQG